MEYTIISADNHINEPPNIYVERVPRDLRERAPRVVRCDDGGDGWSMDGTPPRMSFGLGAIGAIAKGNPKEFRASGLTWGEIPPGSYIGAECLKEMALDGVDAAVIYPGTVAGAYDLHDRALALACVSAYNDWLIDDFCSADPDRLISLPFVPVDDGLDVALAEAERVLEKGARALYLPLPEVPYYSPVYDRLWQLATEANVAVSIHRTGTSKSEAQPPTSAGKGAQPGLNAVGIVQRFYVAINPITYLIFTGLFERFPRLRFVAGEVNCHWVTGLAQEMDHCFQKEGHWANLPLEVEPSSYLGRNIFVSILDDIVGCQLAKTDPIVARTAMFSNDYPHSVCLWPRSQEHIAKMTEGLSEETRYAILAGNAIRAYALA
jgi:predicted TIM-barrel fold metal-dependent hydrolase